MTRPEMTESDAVGGAFRDLHTRVTAAVTGPSANDIMAVGRRRRITRIAVAGGATVVAIVAAFVLVGPTRGALQPAEPTAPPVTSVPSGTRMDVAAIIPTGFFLYEANADERVDDGQVFEPCFGRPRVVAAVARSVGEGPSLTRVIHDLYVYPDEFTARQAFAALRLALQACVGFDGSTQLDADTPALGDEAASVTIAIPADGAGEHTGEPLTSVAVRVGAAVAVFTSFPGYAEIQKEAADFVPRLCLYDPDCQPRPGLPEPLTALHNGGDAWAAVLDILVDGATARPGVAIAAAAELGYHARLVPIACDEGAHQVLGATDRDARYVAVYFRSRSDAEALAAALPALRVRVVPVRTFCVSD